MNDTVQERRLEVGRQRRVRTRANIVAAAFDLFGSEEGLFTRIEDIAAKAGVTRATFYNHFSGMAELREAVSYEVTHDFLQAVNTTTSRLADPRERASTAIRLYLRRAREDRRWGWSMVNISANGIVFGAETFRQAEVTVAEGMEAGLLRLRSSALGRDLVLGTALSAISSLLRGEGTADHPELVAGHILLSMGVPFDTAR
ncbi:MAG TPA: helix-turn-helix domain-containing protein, partial [Devosia sp.]|nr:helix-turn-helix domain-containing protein [Devosia sp.]